MVDDQTETGESSEPLNFPLEAIYHGSWDWMISEGTMLFSPHCFALLGYEPTENSQTFESFAKMIHPDDFQQARKIFYRHARQGEQFVAEMRLKTKSNTWLWVIVRGTMVKIDANGRPLRMVGVINDISQRKLAEMRMQKEVERGKRLLELYEIAPQLTEIELYNYVLDQSVALTDSAIGFFHRVSEDQEYIDLTTWNQAALNNCKIPAQTHYPIDQAGNWVDCVREKRPVIFNDYLKSPNQKGLPEGHTPLQRFMSIPVIEGGKVRIIFGVGNKSEPYDEQDVIQIQLVAKELEKIIRQRRSDEALRENESMLSAAQRIGQLGSWVRDVKNNTINWSEEAYRTFQVAVGEPMSVEAFFRVVHPDDIPRLLQAQQNARSGLAQLNIEYRIVLPSGEIRHLHERSEAVTDSNGAVVKIKGTVQDITERKRAHEEIEKLNRELEQRVLERTAQLEAANHELEAFAYTISHDLRAPLRHINGFVELLREESSFFMSATTREYMKVISTSAKQMGSLIDDLLSYTHMGRKEMQHTRVNLNELVQEALREFESEIMSRRIDWQVASLPEVNGDRAMLHIVLLDLISNALKFTRPRPQAQIEIGSSQETPGELIFFVRDNGVGFDMQYAHKLFGVFQRLHRTTEFEGNGIGLANVRRIIARHGGRTWAAAALDQGATIYFTLPDL